MSKIETDILQQILRQKSKKRWCFTIFLVLKNNINISWQLHIFSLYQHVRVLSQFLFECLTLLLVRWVVIQDLHLFGFGLRLLDFHFVIELLCKFYFHCAMFFHRLFINCISIVSSASVSTSHQFHLYLFPY